MGIRKTIKGCGEKDLSVLEIEFSAADEKSMLQNCISSITKIYGKKE